MSEEDTNKTIGIDVFKQLMEEIKGDLISKIDETAKKADDNFKLLTQKNEEQDGRLVAIEDTTKDLRKRIEELEKSKTNSYADMAARAPLNPEAGPSTVTNKENNDNDTTKKDDENSIRDILSKAKCIVGLQPIDEEDIARNKWDGEDEEAAISNAVDEFLECELKFNRDEIDSLGIDTIKRSVTWYDTSSEDTGKLSLDVLVCLVCTG